MEHFVARDLYWAVVIQSLCRLCDDETDAGKLYMVFYVISLGLDYGKLLQLL